jgi:hypothetical protein
MGSPEQNFYNDALARQGFGDDVRAVQQLWLSGQRDAAAARVPAEIGYATNLLGTPDMVAGPAPAVPGRGHHHPAGQDRR